jgi:hypothetical protein
MVEYRSSLKNTWRMNSQPILNKNPPQAHMELEFDMLGVPEKLVNCVVYSFKKKKFEKEIFFLLTIGSNNK